MMKAMRENTKIILWIVVVAFVITIFAVWGLDLQSSGQMSTQSVVGKIDDVTITPETYQAIYTQLSQQMRANNPTGTVSAAQEEMIREQAWENIVNNVLTSREVERLGITVTDEEVLSTIRTSPPPEIQQYFQDDKGNFDFAAYQQALNNPEADWTSVEQMVRQRVPVVKLNQYLMAQVHVTQSEITRALQEENAKMVAEYVAFSIDEETPEGAGPTDEDVNAYYQSHQTEYQLPEQAVLEVVRIPIEPSQQDRDDLVYTATSIRNDVVNQGDFEGAAKAYSESHTATVGGETGFIGAAQRDPAVIAALDALKPGDVSDVVTTADGVAIVQLIATKKEKGETLYNFREIVLKLSPSSTTTDAQSVIAHEIQQEALESGDLAAAANKRGLEIVTSQPFAKGLPIPGVGYVPALTRFAFARDAGSISNVISDEKNFYIARIQGRTPAAARPLAEVAEGIKATLVRDAKTESARRKARAFLRSANAPEAKFDQVASQYGHDVAKTDSFSVASPVAGLPPYSAFARAALAGQPGDVVGPVESGSAVYVIRITGRSEPEPAVLSTQIPAMRERLLQQKVQSYVMYWFNQLKENSKIEDLRDAS
ncbi:MAG TPA: SurA N-terminal domain-containing protein [Candidatus Krumholzibacteria bacterium]|nr:SurA N-terminal domain-containing protein [Candidatus Krumholzibacteria bacterium]